MPTSNNTQRIDKRYIGITALAVTITWLIHEWAHWQTGKLLGYQMTMTLNSAFPTRMYYAAAQHHHHIISAAGPITTLIEAILVCILMKKANRGWLYPFLFTCFYSRLLAFAISFLNLNDEARISKYLGIGTFTLPFIVTAFLFSLLYTISRQYQFPKKLQWATFGWVVLFTTILIVSDQFLNIRLL